MNHPILPIFDSNSKILILGSFPSVKSREEGFYYAHPRNRFWPVLAKVFTSKTPVTIEEKRNFLLQNQIALWDIIGSCDVSGSADSSIRCAIANDLTPILKVASIRHIFLNGKKTAAIYSRIGNKPNDIEATCLPSTSPANATCTWECLVTAWQKLTNFL